MAMKQVVQDVRTGETSVLEVPIPSPGPGTALVRTAASLVSAGTERALVEFTSRSLVGKARSRPDLVRQVLEKARREGLLSTFRAVQNRLDQPMPLGYSSSGTVVAVGDGLVGYRVGDRVACAGGGYAVHAEYAVVPQNLLAHLPDDVDYEHGAFSTLAAIALHGFRLAEPQVGERVAVIGLGVLGQLAVGIVRGSGCPVFGVDLDPARVEMAARMGAEAVTRPDAEAAAAAFSQGMGCDVVLICADTPSDDPIELAGAVARDRGRVVVVGDVGMAVPRRSYYQKEIQLIVSRSYGPGRYDPLYEEVGVDYPAGYVRWTEGRNLQACVQWMAEGRLQVGELISHRFAIDRATEAYDLILGKTGEPSLGVLLTYPWAEAEGMESDRRIATAARPVKPSAVVRLGALGGGNYANAVLFPSLQGMKDIEFVGLVTATGLTGAHTGRRFGFRYVTTEETQLLADEDINTVAVLTRHHLHASQVIAALQADKHVFCEKPLALSEQELKEVLSAMMASERLLMVGFNRRFAPLAQRMKSFVEGIREPKVMHYRVNAGYLPADHWLHDPAQGGGRILGEACHFIDFLSFLAGAAPVRVSAQGLPDLGRYHEDNVTITLEFPDGSLGTLAYLACGDRAYPKERVEVLGGGTVSVLDDFRRLETTASGRRRLLRSRLQQDKGHRGEWQAFIRAIRAGGPAPIPYEHLIGVSLASFAAVRALRNSEPVTLDPPAIG